MSLTDEDRELLELIVNRAAVNAIGAYFASQGITADHWAHLRREEAAARSNGQIVRRVLLTAVLTAATVLGVNSLTDWIGRQVSHAIDQRDYDHRPILPPSMDIEP